MVPEEVEDLQDDWEFDYELIGNFGRFVSSGSYPVEYFMTSMPMGQAYKYLKFASDVKMEDVDFDLLMQRDIDEERVESDIMPYLQQDEATAATRPLFFPPLLVAIVPMRGRTIGPYYGSKKFSDPRAGFKGVTWEGHFQLYGKETDSADGLPLTSAEDSPKIKAKQAILALRTEEMHEDGVMLIVIDGQHRLRALQRLYDEHTEKVRDIVVPVCILYPPQSYQGADQIENTPSVPRVFRNLFVDVNSTMRVVGGHFNILLSDKNVGDISCRVFCDSVLQKYGKPGLACVEWNTRSPKKSYNVTRKYTLTSIGILQKGLDENFKPDMLVHYLLRITQGAEDLFPDDADPDEYFPKIKWDHFSYAQSNAIKERVREYMAPLLERLFFESEPYKELYDHFLREVGELQAEEERGGKPGIAAQAILQNILEYKPLDNSEPSFRNKMTDFENRMLEHRRAAGLEIVTYALFQRAVFAVAGSFMRLGLEFQIEPNKAFDGLLTLVNEIFKNNRSVFDPDRSYLQFTVFYERRIRTRDDTKMALRDLLNAHLLDKDIRDKVASTGFGDAVDGGKVRSKLLDLGFESAGEFLGRYREERSKAFRKGFDFDYSLTQEERENLKMKEMEQKSREREVKEGRREEGSFVPEFDKEVDEYIKGYLADAKAELRTALGISGDLLERENEEDTNGSEDE